MGMARGYRRFGSLLYIIQEYMYIIWQYILFTIQCVEIEYSVKAMGSFLFVTMCVSVIEVNG